MPCAFIHPSIDSIHNLRLPYFLGVDTSIHGASQSLPLACTVCTCGVRLLSCTSGIKPAPVGCKTIDVSTELSSILEIQQLMLPSQYVWRHFDTFCLFQHLIRLSFVWNKIARRLYRVCVRTFSDAQPLSPPVTCPTLNTERLCQATVSLGA